MIVGRPWLVSATGWIRSGCFNGWHHVLLTTAESKLGPEGWRRFEDPFAQADLEIDLQEDERESE